MKLVLSEEELVVLLTRQISNFFFITESDTEIISNALSPVLCEIELCFKKCKNKYYNVDGAIVFDPLHSGQYIVFLCFFARYLSLRLQNKTLADKIYYLNKIMNSVDVYHEVQLPNIIFFEHPLGSVLGRAKYSNYLCIYQNCTIGGYRDKKKGSLQYPELEEKVILFSGASVIGNSYIGGNSVIGGNAKVKNEDIPENSLVFGESPHLIIKEKDEYYTDKFEIWN
jgi:serine O-acetyltransferase